MENDNGFSKSTLLWIAAGLVAVLILLANTSTPVDSSQSPPKTVDDQSLAISDATGISLHDIRGSFTVVARYGLSDVASAAVVNSAAEIYSLESSDKYDAVLKQAGVGSVSDIADGLAHVIQAWGVPDAAVSDSADAIFNKVTQSTYTWKQLLNVLIENGPKIHSHVSLAEYVRTYEGQ